MKMQTENRGWKIGPLQKNHPRWGGFLCVLYEQNFTEIYACQALSIHK
jgi:hypothetical protein